MKSLLTTFHIFQGIMLVYDITNEKSFDNIRNWIRNIEEVRYTLPEHTYVIYRDFSRL